MLKLLPFFKKRNKEMLPDRPWFAELEDGDCRVRIARPSYEQIVIAKTKAVHQLGMRLVRAYREGGTV